MSEFNAEDVVVLGRFNSPFGIQGWIKIYSYTDPMENIQSYRPWLVMRNGEWQPIKVSKTKKQGKGLIAKLDNVDTPQNNLPPSDDLIDLDEALEKLAKRDPAKANLVKLRYFAGLTGEQAAKALNISHATADRYWDYACSWLRLEIIRNRQKHSR